MRLTRVFVDSPLVPDADVPLPDAAANHVGRVLRLREGAVIVAFDGSGNDYRCEILVGQGRRGAGARRARAASGCQSRRLRITLVQAVSRGERMDWTLQKATELGVRTIVPVLSSRSVVRLDERQAGKKLRHWQAIVAGACEQCGRSMVPEIRPPQELSSYLASSTPRRAAPRAESDGTRVARGPDQRRRHASNC